MTTGKWRQRDVPHRGWTCVDIYDDGEDGEELSHVCEMCETQLIRYVHVMQHPNYPETLGVGCICAGNMEGDYARAKSREQEHKRRSAKRAAQRKNWLRRHWQTSRAGNDYLNVDDFNVVVYRRGAHWSARVENRVTGLRRFSGDCATVEEAKLAAFNDMSDMRKSTA